MYTRGLQMKDLIENKTELELAQSLLAEAAKSRNELNCAAADIQKAQSRISFMIVLANRLIERNTK